MTGWARAVDYRERVRSTDRVSKVVTMVGAIEILAVPAPVVPLDVHFIKVQVVSGLQWENYVGPNTTRARLIGKVVGIIYGIHAWRVHAASKIGFCEASIALLHIFAQILGRASHRVTGKHTETLQQLD